MSYYQVISINTIRETLIFLFDIPDIFLSDAWKVIGLILNSIDLALNINISIA